MGLPRKTLVRHILLNNMEQNIAYTLDDIAELVYGDCTDQLKHYARRVVEGAIEYGLVRQLVSGRYKITAYGRAFLRSYQER